MKKYEKDLKTKIKEISFSKLDKQKQQQNLLIEDLLRKTVVDFAMTIQKRTRYVCKDEEHVFPTEKR